MFTEQNQTMNLQFESKHAPKIQQQTKPLNSKEKFLHETALQKAKNYKSAHAELLDIVVQVDTTRLFEKILLTSTFSYCIKQLGLSEDVTCTLTRLARVSQTVPELKHAIDQGEMSISNARKIAAVVTPENKSEWIEKAKALSQAKLEREVAKSFPQQAVQEKIKYVAEERLRLELGIFEKTMQRLKRAQDIVSQKSAKAASLEDTLEAILEDYLKRNDPLVIAERARKKIETRDLKKAQQKTKNDVVQANALVGQQTDQKPDRQKDLQDSLAAPDLLGARRGAKRKRISAPVNHKILIRDGGGCQASMPDGSTCQAKRWLHKHHIIPVRDGGQDSAENLILLCSPHHRMSHR